MRKDSKRFLYEQSSSNDFEEGQSQRYGQLFPNHGFCGTRVLSFSRLDMASAQGH